MSIIRDYIDGQFRNEKKEEVGIAGFTAFVRIMEKTIRLSDVPTVYLEDGTPISDHIIRKPLTLIIEGNVSDVYVKPAIFDYAIKRVRQELGVISQYIPVRTDAQAFKIASFDNDFTNAVSKIDSAIEAGQQLTGYLGLTEKVVGRNIKSFVDAMEAIFLGSTLISIDMSYNRYDRMRITRLETEKNNEDDSISFRMEAKQINYVSEVLIPVKVVKAPSDNVDGQLDNEADKGVQDGEDVPHSFISYIFSLFGGS